jgi:hypothetical protein
LRCDGGLPERHYVCMRKHMHIVRSPRLTCELLFPTTAVKYPLRTLVASRWPAAPSSRRRRLGRTASECERTGSRRRAEPSLGLNPRNLWTSGSSCSIRGVQCAAFRIPATARTYSGRRCCPNPVETVKKLRRRLRRSVDGQPALAAATAPILV